MRMFAIGVFSSVFHPLELMLEYSRQTVNSSVVVLERRSLRRLTHSTILIRAHFHAKSNQDLFHPHVAIPAAHGGQLVVQYFARLGVDTGHIDARNEADFRRYGRILFWNVNAQFVKATVMLCLCKEGIKASKR